MPTTRRSDKGLRRFAPEVLPGKSVRHRAHILERCRSNVAKERLARIPPCTKFQAVLGHSTEPGADTLFGDQRHDLAFHVHGRYWRPPGIPHKSRGHGADL